MSDDTGEVRETRDTPAAEPAPPASAPSAPEAGEARETRETRETPPADAAPPAQQQAADPFEHDPAYQQLPEAWKRKVRDGSETSSTAALKHSRNQQGYALRIQRQTQERSAQEAAARQQQDLRYQARLDQLTRLLTGEAEPEAEPVDPLAQRLDLLGQKVDQVGLLAQQQAVEAQISQQIDGIETWTASDVANVLPHVPDYEQREDYVLSRIEDGELLAVQQEYPHASDQDAQAEAHRRTQAQVANMILNYATRGQSLASEVARLAEALGYGQAPQQQYAAPAPPPQRQTETGRQIEVQRQRAQSAASLAGGARPSTFKGSPEQMQDAILNLSDEKWDEFMGDGPDRKERLKALLQPYAVG